MILTNAFSISMLDADAAIQFNQIDLTVARQLAIGAESAVGHAEIASIFSGLLGIPVEVNRRSVKLEQSVLVGQYHGPRLPEGATALPEGAEIEWWHVIRLKARRVY